MTFAEIFALLDYDPLTGIFRWKVTTGRANAGDIAGSVSKKSGYLQIRIKGKLFYGHRLAWFLTHGYWPTRVDHRNLNKSANWLDNLREATQAENNKNVPVQKNNIAGFKGVRLHPDGAYTAQITHNHKSIHIGSFGDPVSAATAYDEMALKLHQSFAMTNKMLGLLP